MPRKQFDDAFQYFVAVPSLILMQKVVFSSPIEFIFPRQLSELWTLKSHMRGWQFIDMLGSGPHMIVHGITTTIMNRLQAPSVLAKLDYLD